MRIRTSQEPDTVPYGPEHIAACDSVVAKLEAKLAARPIPRHSGSILLRRPDCEEACLVCHLECAIIPSRLDWWRKEAARVRDLAGSALTHNGAVFAEPAGRA